jgi:undecaprenyl-diphosphatase
MDWLQAFVLGLIQGLTEFLPVSSTGHLYLGRHFFGLDKAGLFLDTMLHLGTLLAVITVYWRELLGLIRRPFSRLSLLLIIGTIPALAIGYLFADFFDYLETTGITIGWEFLITGTILWISDGIKNKGYKELEKISYLDALIIGLAQAVAIFPAISRSGMTIAAALFRKINKETAAYFSFLLSIPAIAVAIAYQSLKLFKGNAADIAIPLPALVIGIIVAAISGYIAVRWMIATLKKGSLKGFAIYVWVLGLIILAVQYLHIF